MIGELDFELFSMNSKVYLIRRGNFMIGVKSNYKHN